MKRYILILLIALTATAAHAQFRYGPAVGATITNLTFKQDIVDVNRVAGGTAGIQAEMMFPGIGFGIDLGLLYDMGGAKVNLGEKKIWAVDGYGNERLTLHYIQIPVHLRFKWTRMGGLEDIVAPFVFGGPEFNILAGHSKCDAMDYAGGTLSLSAGLGFEFRKHWQISGCYGWGMTYAMKGRLLDNWSARQNGWTVRLTYLF